MNKITELLIKAVNLKDSTEITLAIVSVGIGLVATIEHSAHSPNEQTLR
jgi:hypothetical protein